MASDNQGISPGGNTLGWYAVNDKVLDADVIINVPKIKTHQEMMATISIKNFVGCTLCSTYDEAGHLERIAHHHEPRESNYFTNDIFWRAILDMNKIILYAGKDGVLQPEQQRMYLSVVDGIQAMERGQHHSEGIPYNSHVVLAGVDPIAVDAVGCRIMGYDLSVIPSIGNAHSDLVHPIGINDPNDIVIVGDDIDSEIAHVFTYNDNWEQDADDLDITDFTPPTINSVIRDGNTVTANISGGLTAYLLYQTDGTEYIEIMNRNDDIYSVTTAEAFTAYKVRAQDEYFNAAQEAPPSSEIISLTVTDYGNDGIFFGSLAPGMNNQPADGQPGQATVTLIINSETNVDVDVQLRATNFTGPSTIDVSNIKYDDDSDFSDALTMTVDYVTWYSVAAPLGEDHITPVYHRLSIPEGQPAGTYNSIFSYRAIKSP